MKRQKWKLLQSETYILKLFQYTSMLGIVIISTLKLVVQISLVVLSNIRMTQKKNFVNVYITLFAIVYYSSLAITLVHNRSYSREQTFWFGEITNQLCSKPGTKKKDVFQSRTRTLRSRENRHRACLRATAIRNAHSPSVSTVISSVNVASSLERERERERDSFRIPLNTASLRQSNEFPIMPDAVGRITG